jgi:hypothetical protein
MLRLTTLGLALIALAALPAPPAIEPAGTVEFAGTWDDDTNFSAAVQVGNVVLVASDEIGRLQTGTLAGNRVTRGADVRLQEQSGADVELDIEALAVSGSTVYALGSHSDTRSSSHELTRTAAKNLERLREGKKERAERDVLLRFTYNASTGQAGPIARASLRPAIAADTKVLAPFLDLPGKENGVDLEGLAVDGTTLFAGFRGPVLRHGFVPVLRTTFDQPGQATLLFVPLDGRGIRDLVKVPDGFLLLAGPVGDGDAPHRVYLWNGKDCIPGKNAFGGTLKLLGDIAAPAAGGKAEALMLTGETAQAYEALVLFDSLPKGGATRVRIGKASAGATASTELCGQQPAG